MPTCPWPPHPASSTTPASVLAAWEAAATPAQVTAQLPHQPALLAFLTELAALPRLDVNVDLEDVRTVLHGAGAARATQVTAAGPTRAAEALQQLRARLPIGQLARHCLLSVLSSPTASLEMDELSEITQTLHTWLTADGDMVFGHGEWPELPPGAVQVWVLLAYADTPPPPLQEQLSRIRAEKAAALAQEDYEAVARLRAVEVRLMGQLNASPT